LKIVLLAPFERTASIHVAHPLNDKQVQAKLCSKWSPKSTKKDPKICLETAPPIQESLMPAVRKCPFAPLDKWPAEPLFWAEAIRSLEVQAACWITVLGFYETGKLRNCTKLRKSLLGNGELASLAYGSFKELLKLGNFSNGDFCKLLLQRRLL
jgi:hypothetical protein